MTPTPVGMRCPECMNQRTRVVVNPAGTPGGGLGEIGIRTIYDTGGLWGPAVHELHQWWRIVTSGFVHVSIFHIGFNMLLLYFMGRLLEPAIGWLRFTVLYFVCLIAGSFVALWFSPDTVSAGASGAIFGVLGATFIIARGRGMEAIAGQIGFLIIFNLVFTFAESGISVGAHVGGLVAGVLCGLLIVAGEQGRYGRGLDRKQRLAIEISLMTVIGVISFILALAVA